MFKMLHAKISLLLTLFFQIMFVRVMKNQVKVHTVWIIREGFTEFLGLVGRFFRIEAVKTLTLNRSRL